MNIKTYTYIYTYVYIHMNICVGQGHVVIVGQPGAGTTCVAVCVARQRRPVYLHHSCHQ